MELESRQGAGQWYGPRYYGSEAEVSRALSSAVLAPSPGGYRIVAESTEPLLSPDVLGPVRRARTFLVLDVE